MIQMLNQQKFNDSELIISWIKKDPYRMELLRAARELDLYQWCLAAGFVRNLVWDKLHGYTQPTALSDIDLIYFDPYNLCEEHEKALEARLNTLVSAPWSVKNQARMHLRNGDQPYSSTLDAMAYWVEVETAIGARICNLHQVEVVSPFDVIIDGPRATINPKRPKLNDFLSRIENKNWTKIWPDLTITR